MSRPYQTVNAEQLQRDADSCLLTYGTSFYPEIITSTDGIYFETASGHRMMDVRTHIAQIARLSWTHH
jgi:4-aminobutyrate aminotransferase-like enzyme